MARTALRIGSACGWTAWFAASCARPAPPNPAASGDRATYTLATPVWSELIPGARIAVLATTGEGAARATLTHLGDCVDVVEVLPPDRVVVAVPTGLALDAAVPEGAAIRAAACRSAATPVAAQLGPDARALPIPDTVPARLVDALYAGDLVDVYATFDPGDGPQTVTLLTGVALGGDPVDSLIVDRVRAEALAHAVDGARIALGVAASPVPEPDHLAGRVPPGLVCAVIDVADPGALFPFAAADPVDLTVAVGGTASTFVQAAALAWQVRRDDGRGSLLGLLVPPALGEAVAHADAWPIVASLRGPGDTGWVDPGAPGPDPQPELAPPGVTPSDRLGHGMRGVSLPTDGDPPAVGDRVSVVGVGADGARTELARQRLVAAVATASEPATALVQVTPREVKAIALAGATGAQVVASTDGASR